MSGKGTVKNFADMLGTAKLPERTVPICLRGDLVAEFEDLERELEDAEKDRGNSFDAGAASAELADRMEALREEMKEQTYTFRVRALSRRAYRALVAEHPPRKAAAADGTEKVDEADGFGFNADTFFEALLRVALVDPELSSKEFDGLLDRLTDRQFDELAGSAWLLNRTEVDIPFSQAASKLTRNTSPA